MKIEYKLFVILAVFFVPVGVAYGHFTGWAEPVGTVGLFLSAGLGAMIAFYLYVTGRRLPERPEDNPGGEIAEQEGDYGFFSPHSWWPLPLAAAAAVCFLGLAVGWWLFIIGAAFGVVALVGWTFEYFKGPHAV
jgi:Cytochrome c oxidase subunit IV